jgi:DNA-binding MarR family transcriptional regulator
MELLREYREQLFVLGVTPVQARILLYLERNPRSYIMQCARAFGLTGRSVGYPVRVLERKRWVTKQPAPQDDRYVVLTLTPKGTDLARAIKQHVDSPAWRKR